MGYDEIRAKIVQGSKNKPININLLQEHLTKGWFMGQWFGQSRFSFWSSWLVERSEDSELRAATVGQSKSTGYFMKLRDWSEFDFIHPAGANRLIVGSKAVRAIDGYN